ncbi:MAG: hypothetical protein P4L71_15395 [Acetobacteraceae bacterium]|nr:hypothetical protein [Acetobacteraceae bacterium]
MDTTVDVTIPVEESVAALLQDPLRRADAGRMLSRLLERNQGVPELLRAIERLKDDAHAAGLTDQLIDEELAAYNAERRG